MISDQKKIKSLKYCFISYEYPPNGGGIATYVKNAADVLSKHGVDVTVITALNENPVNPENFNIYYCDTQRYNRIASFLLRLSKKFHLFGLFDYLFFQIRLLRTFSKLNKKSNFDFLELPDYLGDGFLINLFKRLLFPKLIVITRLHSSTLIIGKYYKLERGSKYLGIRIGEYINYKFSHHLIAPSKLLIDLSKSIVSKEIIKFPLFIDQELLRNKSEIKEENILRVIYPNRLQDGKGAEIFLKAALKIVDKFPDAQFIFAGADTLSSMDKKSMYQYLLSKIPEKHFSNFKFTGGLKREFLLKYLSQSNICVIPSYYDNYPYTCLEAMSFGVPVIASSNTGTEEIINEYNCGLVFKNGSDDDLARKLTTLINDNSSRIKLGKNGIDAIARDLNPNTLTKNYIELLGSFKK